MPTTTNNGPVLRQPHKQHAHSATHQGLTSESIKRRTGLPNAPLSPSALACVV
jgi:hypothetical protein